MKNGVRFLIIILITLLIIVGSYFCWNYATEDLASEKNEQKTLSTATIKSKTDSKTVRKTAGTSYGIAIVDMKKVASESKAGKSIETQIMEINDQSKKDLADLEAKIKSMESSKTTEEDSRKIEDLHLILYDMIRDKRLQISNAYKTAVAQLEERIKESIAEISELEKIKLVITTDAVVHFKQPVRDITGEVVKFLDNLCTEIEVKFKQSGGF
jgi:Skp family chaperone for outer membrane proteins